MIKNSKLKIITKCLFLAYTLFRISTILSAMANEPVNPGDIAFNT